MTEELNPQVCAVCNSPEIVAGYTIPLCKTCREAAIRRQIPIWLRMVVLIIGFFVVFAAFRLPRELSAAIAFDRGETAESKHDYKNAAANYEQTLAFYPKATLVWERMAVAANRSGDKEKRNQALNTLADLARADPNSDAGRYLFKATMEMNGPHP